MDGATRRSLHQQDGTLAPGPSQCLHSQALFPVTLLHCISTCLPLREVYSFLFCLSQGPVGADIPESVPNLPCSCPHPKLISLPQRQRFSTVDWLMVQIRVRVPTILVIGARFTCSCRGYNMNSKRRLSGNRYSTFAGILRLSKLPDTIGGLDRLQLCPGLV